MSTDKRPKRDRHALNDDGMVLCNPRDKEAAHRAEMEGIATEDRAAVTCRKCSALLHERDKVRNGLSRSPFVAAWRIFSWGGMKGATIGASPRAGGARFSRRRPFFLIAGLSPGQPCARGRAPERSTTNGHSGYSRLYQQLFERPGARPRPTGKVCP